uniref:Uncharacterized protein n=1 Tax=Spumella elongata TaxID=89044 RepID=A0A7S3MB35_9STRA
MVSPAEHGKGPDSHGKGSGGFAGGDDAGPLPRLGGKAGFVNASTAGVSSVGSFGGCGALEYVGSRSGLDQDADDGCAGVEYLAMDSDTEGESGEPRGVAGYKAMVPVCRALANLVRSGTAAAVAAAGLGSSAGSGRGS